MNLHKGKLEYVKTFSTLLIIRKIKITEIAIRMATCRKSGIIKY